MSGENNINTTAETVEEKTNSMLWEDISKEKIRSEITTMCDNLDSLKAEAEKLVKDKNNYDKTKEALEKLRDGDFGSAGWISSFINENANSFPGLGGGDPNKASKPDFYYMLLPDKKKKYDDILEYMGDLVKLKAFFKPFADVLRNIPLRDAFRVFAIVKNMNSRGWNNEEYQRINKDIESVCDLLKLNWSEMNSQAVLCQRFYEENRSQMDSPKMKDGYIIQRQDDYDKIFRKYSVSKICNYVGRGRYRMDYDTVASMKTLDTYMEKLVTNKDLDEKLKTVLASIENLLNSLMSNIVLKTGSGRVLHQTMKNLIVVIQFLLIRSLEEFTKFKEGATEAPYCFMKCPEAASKASGYFGFNPGWGNSWDKGTFYYNTYKQILYAITTQCREFVYEHGLVK